MHLSRPSRCYLGFLLHASSGKPRDPLQRERQAAAPRTPAHKGRCSARRASCALRLNVPLRGCAAGAGQAQAALPLGPNDPAHLMTHDESKASWEALRGHGRPPEGKSVVCWVLSNAKDLSCWHSANCPLLGCCGGGPPDGGRDRDRPTRWP